MSTELRVDLIPNGNPDVAMYQASKCLSATNHRLYRQFRSYNCKAKLTAPYTGAIEVYILKDTWMVRNAIKQACKVYMNTQVSQPGQTNKPARWHDFRIKPTNPAGNEIAQLIPTGFVTNNVAGPVIYNTTSTGQYDYSDVRSQNSGVTSGFVIGGVTGNDFDIIQAYMDLDDTSADEAQSNDAYSAFFQAHAPQLDVDDEGDLAPYNMTDLNNYWVKVDTIHTGKPTTASFDAPLGWILFRHNAEIESRTADATWSESGGTFQNIANDGSTTAILQVIHSPGKYKGVKSTPMGKIVKINSQEYDVK